VSTPGRVALVTGAARGIGAATVHELASQGWSVMALDIAQDDDVLPYALASLADLAAVVEAADADGRVASYVADVRDRQAVENAVAETVERWGGLDAAIGCAGAIAGGEEQWKLSPELEQTMLDINLGGVLSLARAAVPAMLDRPKPRSGRFLAVSSAAATKGFPMLAAYCAAKAGINGAIRAIAAELGGTGITANAVCPGSTTTDLLEESARIYGLAGSQDFARQQPIGRLLEPSEVASVLAFLASEQSGGVTGAAIPVDGGLSL